MPQKRFKILFIILLLACGTWAQQQDGSVFERRVSINAENQPLSSILDQISWQARVYFSYDAAQIQSEKKYSVQAIEKSLYSVLTSIFNFREFRFRE
ncbi:MAG: hypothetical protein ACOCWK_09785, partial [Tangfeifania sp.]